MRKRRSKTKRTKRELRQRKCKEFRNKRVKELIDQGVIDEDTDPDNMVMTDVKGFRGNSFGRVEEIEAVLSVLDNVTGDRLGGFDDSMIELFKDLGIEGDYLDVPWIKGQLQAKLDEVNKSVSEEFDKLTNK